MYLFGKAPRRVKKELLLTKNMKTRVGMLLKLICLRGYTARRRTTEYKARGDLNASWRYRHYE